MSGAKYTAVIAGASGAVGSALAQELAAREEWQVIGLSRQVPKAAPEGVTYFSVDLEEPDAVRGVLAQFDAISHLYYCARKTHAEQTIEDAPGNLALLRNAVDGVTAVSPGLSHVHVVQGGKYYGVHIGPFTVPATEDGPRAPVENFNYAHQDFLEQHADAARWTWTVSRPNTLLHFSPLNARNLVSTLGAYASICRELGAALDFPGHSGAYDSITQVTTLTLLARAIAWMSTEPACANQAFNVVNTDVFRWRELWSRLADAFGIPVGSVRPMQLVEVLAERQVTWQAICEAKGLRARALSDVANWGFADATLERYWDEILSHNKLRRFGFDDWDDSVDRFFSVLEQYRGAGILPR